MSDTSPVSLICCDVVGAAAADGSIMERAFAEAIATQGVVVGTAAYVRSMVQFDRTRGWPPADVMRNLFPEDEIRAQAANHAFERSFQAAVDRANRVTRSWYHRVPTRAAWWSTRVTSPSAAAVRR